MLHNQEIIWMEDFHAMLSDRRLWKILEIKRHNRIRMPDDGGSQHMSIALVRERQSRNKRLETGNSGIFHSLIHELYGPA